MSSNGHTWNLVELSESKTNISTVPKGGKPLTSENGQYLRSSICTKGNKIKMMEKILWQEVYPRK